MDYIDNFLVDWLDRDGETFVRKRKTKRLGWEETLKEGEAYSSYLMDAPDLFTLMHRAYGNAKEMLVAMDLPHPVKVKILSDMSVTDGKEVFIATEVFDDKKLSVGEKLDVFLGLTIHEGAHVLYTDMSVLKDIKENKVIHTILNILEDERIEMNIGEHKPGFANFLEKVKAHYFGKRDEKFFDKEDKAAHILNTLLLFIRYPKFLTRDDLEYFGDAMDKVREVLTPYPDTTRKTFECAKLIYNILFNDLKEKSKEEEGKGDADSDSKGKKGSGGQTMVSSALADFDISLEIASALSDLDLGDVVSKPTSLGDIGKGKISVEVKMNDSILGEVCEGTSEMGETRKSFFRKTEGKNIDLYRNEVRTIRPYIPAIAKAIKGHFEEMTYLNRSMRSGTLDTGKLVEAVQGVPTVYTSMTKRITDKIDVCVLIDQSGSMGGKRITQAKSAAILINEALKDINGVGLYIYGHTADLDDSNTSTDLTIYRENGYTPKASLADCKADNQNRDGVAIYEVARRVRKQTKNHVVMFILSDGAPCAYGYVGSSAMRHVKEQVTKAEKMGFTVIQICINHSYEPRHMFKNYIILEDLKRLSIDLGKIIKKTVLKEAKVRQV